MWDTFAILFSPKFYLLDGKENSVDTGQTAPEEQSDLGLRCLYMQFDQRCWSSMEY